MCTALVGESLSSPDTLLEESCTHSQSQVESRLLSDPLCLLASWAWTGLSSWFTMIGVLPLAPHTDQFSAVVHNGDRGLYVAFNPSYFMRLEDLGFKVSLEAF